MKFNDITFPDIKGLDNITGLMDSQARYLVLVQYEDIIDWYVLSGIGQSVLHQLAYYLYIAYDIRVFNQSNIEFIQLDLYAPIDSKYELDTMNAYQSNLINDMHMHPSLGY